jgi:hypothetical protein
MIPAFAGPHAASFVRARPFSVGVSRITCATSGRVGPKVRIRFPPAISQVRTRGAASAIAEVSAYLTIDNMAHRERTRESGGSFVVCTGPNP